MVYIRILVAVLLFPVTLIVNWNFFYLLIGLGRKTSAGTLPFWLGLIVYYLFQIVFFKPIRTYVFGHELTHAAAGLLSGARLKSFRVSKKGGSVVLTKTSVWIALAPYFVPIYTSILVLAWYVLGRFFHVAPYYPYFLFLSGFTLSFHFSLTNYAIRQGQSDLKKFGNFFSGTLILLASGLFLSFLLKLLFPQEIVITEYFLRIRNDTYMFFEILYKGAYCLWHYSGKMS